MGPLLERARLVLAADLQSAGAKDDRSDSHTGAARSGSRPLKEAARVYLDAYSQGRSPTKAVADHFGVKPNTAAKWIVECRKLGLLGPTKQGRAGGGPFDGKYARRVLAEAGHSEREIVRIMEFFPRWIEPELIDALKRADAKGRRPKEVE